ncbi:MAG TPA: hypothetical protein PLS10_05560 [Chitinophagales bacterium]|nr:hypothetical protein [Chitinophagales bacterium]
MTYIGLFLDAVSPIVLAIPLIILLAVIAITTFGILWLIAYIRKRNADK